VRLRHLKWNLAPTLALRTAANKASGGCAVAARTGFGLKDNLDTLVPKAFRHRIAVSWVGGIIKGGCHLISLWPRHTELMSEENQEILQVAAEILTAIKGPWVIGGDWNFTPKVLINSKWLDMVKGVVVAPTAPTCHSSVYDFFVVCQALAPAVVAILRLDDAGLFPHFPARIILRSDARRRAIRTLTRPTKIPGCLPFGPALRARSYLQCTNGAIRDHIDDRMECWYRLARQELRAFDPWTKFNDLSQAKFKWQAAIDDIAKPEPGAAAQSSTWRALARRFAEVSKLRCRHDQYSSDLLHRHLRKSHSIVQHLKHDDPLMATLPFWVHAADSATRLGDLEALDSLITVADAHGAKAETTATVEHGKAWREWATHGQKARSGGTLPTRRAFQWLRSPCGWTKAVVGKIECEDSVPYDPADTICHEDDICTQQDPDSSLPREWKNDGTVPLGLQAEVDTAAKGWAGLWEEGNEYIAMVHPDDSLRPPRSRASTSSTARLRFRPALGWR